MNKRKNALKQTLNTCKDRYLNKDSIFLYLKSSKIPKQNKCNANIGLLMNFCMLAVHLYDTGRRYLCSTGQYWLVFLPSPSFGWKTLDSAILWLNDVIKDGYYTIGDALQFCMSCYN